MHCRYFVDGLHVSPAAAVPQKLVEALHRAGVLEGGLRGPDAVLVPTPKQLSIGTSTHHQNIKTFRKVQQAVFWYAHTEVSNSFAAVQAATCCWRTPASWGTRRPRLGHVKSYLACLIHPTLFADCPAAGMWWRGSSQRHAAEIGSARAPSKHCRGGEVSPTRGWDRNFLDILKGLWGPGCRYTAVTLVWAGNDLTRWWTTQETVTHAVEKLKAFGEWYNIPIRRVDVGAILWGENTMRLYYVNHMKNKNNT